MAKHKSSRRWLKEHHEDAYVKKARNSGYRSRAAYKLLELDDRDHLLRRGMTVVDLGAAPGGWSQIAARRVGEQGRVVALDILAMDPIPGVTFIQADFTAKEAVDQLAVQLEGTAIDLVISDMAPNISGIAALDQPRSMYLAELALDFARRMLRPGGAFLAKVFQGEGFDAFMTEVRGSFGKAYTRKPKASRARSREVYVLGRGYNPGNDLEKIADV